MIPTSLHTVGPTLQAMPLALIFSSQLMLTEKASVKDDGFSAVIRSETLTIRATLVTPILKDIPGYHHFLQIAHQAHIHHQAMSNPNNSTKTECSFSVMDAIQHRRSVRDYASKTIERKVIQTLLDAAVHAPTAMHEEPWSFAVVQDKNVLDRLSESAKKLVHNEAQGSDTDRAKHTLHVVDKPDFHVFYNAGTLMVGDSTFAGNSAAYFGGGLC